MYTSWRRILFVFVVALLSARSAEADEPLTIKLTAKEGRFIPERIQVPAGQRFRIEVTNLNAGPEELESRELRKELILAPGITRTLVFAPLKPGTYAFFGEFHPNTARGEIIAK